MKKILLTLACVFGMGIKASALTSSAVLLQHNGNITTYAAEDIAKAMEDAVDGDEVFLNEGTFPGFTISKSIYVRGVGEATIINGDIIIENTEKVLDEVQIAYIVDKKTPKLEVRSEVKLLVLKQIVWTYATFKSAIIWDLVVDRCMFQSPGYIDVEGYNKISNGNIANYADPYVKKITANNSIIYRFNNYYSYTNYPSYTFVNCYVGVGQSSPYVTYGLTLINSIVDASKYLYNSELINSTYDWTDIDETCKMTECYNVGISYSSAQKELTESNYLGNDGTVVGPFGGNTPFTLVPTVPHVTEASLKVDPKKQELNATLTVSPN